MRFHLLKLLALFILCNLCACQMMPQTRSATSPKPTPAANKAFDLPTRNNALALLDELLNEEKHLSKLLFIKRESAELNRLVKDISETADAGVDQLKALKKNDPALAQAATALPPGEKATRESIAKVKQHALLHSSGTELEFQLLITQAEALGYGSHLALVAAENEPQPDRAQGFLALSLRLKTLHGQVLAMLRPKKG